MERKIALKKLGKLLGKKLGYRVDNDALTSEERADVKSAWDAVIKERDAIKEKRDARYKAILAADAEYQTLHAECNAATERAQLLLSKLHNRKITVGILSENFFFQRAEGDSWEEVIDKLQAKERVS